jgi:hypothetical protein
VRDSRRKERETCLEKRQPKTTRDQRKGLGRSEPHTGVFTLDLRVIQKRPPAVRLEEEEEEEEEETRLKG